jgi:NitT/TauT family transport system substrate-binding protein
MSRRSAPSLYLNFTQTQGLRPGMAEPSRIDMSGESGDIRLENHRAKPCSLLPKEWRPGHMRSLILALTALSVVSLSPLPGVAQEKATRVNLGYSSVSGSQAILRVTKDAGIFSKNGLDVSLVLIAGGSGMIQALVAGDLPIAVVSGEPAILARLQGADTVILGGLINIIDFSVITAPEIKRPQDLKGKKLGVSRFGSSTDFVIRYALDKWGLVPDRDVAILQIGSQPARLAALKSGTVHGTIVGPPADIVARKSGFNEIATPEQLNLAYPNTSIVSTASIISKNDDLARRIMRAMVEGIHSFKTQKEASMKSLDAFARLGDAALIDETYRHYQDIIPKVPYPDMKGIQNVLNEIAKKDPKVKSLKPEMFADTRLLKELEASGLIEKLYRYRHLDSKARLR